MQWGVALKAKEAGFTQGGKWMTWGAVGGDNGPLLENKDVLGGHHCYVKVQPWLSYLNLAAEPTHFPLLLI